MTRRFVLITAVLCILVPAGAASAAPAGAAEKSRQHGGVTGVRADVSCHDPCDDSFWLTAFVRGGSVAGVNVTFTVKSRMFTARCDASGYAHYHLKMRPSTYPQGVVVKVTAAVTHGGGHSATTWFKPNYN